MSNKEEEQSPAQPANDSDQAPSTPAPFDPTLDRLPTEIKAGEDLSGGHVADQMAEGAKRRLGRRRP